MRDHHDDMVMARRGPTLIDWRAVFGGAVLSLSIFVLLSTLWLALAYGSDMGRVETSLQWLLGASAIFSMFIGGYLAGLFSGVRGAGAGMMNGMTLWGLFVLITLAIGVPAVMRVLNVGIAPTTGAATGGGTIDVTNLGATWPTFWALLIGLAAAAVGGLLGGVMPRRRSVGGYREQHVEHTTTEVPERTVERRDDEVDHDRTEHRRAV